jgi:hypothetical protein
VVEKEEGETVSLGDGALKEAVEVCRLGCLVGEEAVVGPGGAEEVLWPDSRSSHIGALVLPARNSLAVRAGVADGAGGKMSDWKASDCRPCLLCCRPR